MECFAHASVPAIGACKACGRAVCRNCVIDLSFAIVCSEQCATSASQSRELEERAKPLYGIGTSKRRVPLGTLMWGMFGFLFLAFGIYSWFANGQLELFALIFGAMSLILAIVSYRRAKELQLNC